MRITVAHAFLARLERPDSGLHKIGLMLRIQAEQVHWNNRVLSGCATLHEQHGIVIRNAQKLT